MDLILSINAREPSAEHSYGCNNRSRPTEAYELPLRITGIAETYGCVFAAPVIVIPLAFAPTLTDMQRILEVGYFLEP